MFRDVVQCKYNKLMCCSMVAQYVHAFEQCVKLCTLVKLRFKVLCNVITCTSLVQHVRWCCFMLNYDNTMLLHVCDVCFHVFTYCTLTSTCTFILQCDVHVRRHVVTCCTLYVNLYYFLITCTFALHRCEIKMYDGNPM